MKEKRDHSYALKDGDEFLMREGKLAPGLKSIFLDDFQSTSRCCLLKLNASAASEESFNAIIRFGDERRF